MYLPKLKEMFSEMVLKKNISLISYYYHPDFLLYTNGQITDYNDFLSSHMEYYNKQIEYKIKYDEETLLEQGDKVAGRIWITTSIISSQAKEIEVVLIVQYKDDKIYRLWELTYPDWTKLPKFQD